MYVWKIEMLYRFLNRLRSPKNEDLRVPAKETTASVSFTNMTGYVGIAEIMPLKLLPEFMNQYFEVNCSAILEYEGRIDRFEGDRIMAFWGLNHTAGQSAQLACESAITQMRGMEKFYSWAKGEGHPCPRIRIGISTGTVIMGDVGGRTRSDFTVMGAPVGIAEALQDEAKKCDSAILVDETTRNHATDFRFGEIIEIVKSDSTITAFPIAG